MPRPAQDVTDAELAILKTLWDRGSSTVRQLTEKVYSQYSSSQHATVQKLLERLEGKDCVRRNRGTWPHVFEAAIDRGNLIERSLQQTADKLCDGSWQQLLQYLVQGGKLSAADRETLRKLLEEFDQELQEQVYRESRQPGKR